MASLKTYGRAQISETTTNTTTGALKAFSTFTVTSRTTWCTFPLPTHHFHHTFYSAHWRKELVDINGNNTSRRETRLDGRAEKRITCLDWTHLEPDTTSERRNGKTAFLA